MTPDELKSIPKGEFVVMKTGSHPMRTRLRLFLDWGITFGEPYQPPEHGQRKVYYAGRQELEDAIITRFWTDPKNDEKARPPHEGRAERQVEHKGGDHQQKESQPLATMPDSAKKRVNQPPATDGR